MYSLVLFYMEKIRKSEDSTLEPPEFEDPELAELARSRHALNVALNEYDFNRVQEAARRMGTTSVSDVVRRALREWLDRHPDGDKFAAIARMALEFELATKRMYVDQL